MIDGGVAASGSGVDEAGAVPDPRSRLRAIPWLRLGLLFVVAHAALVLAAAIGVHAGLIEPDAAQYRGTGPYDMWFLWDSYWYERLALRDWLEPLSPSAQEFIRNAMADPGFRQPTPDELHRFSFAPLFPLLAKPFALLTGDAALALVIVSRAAGYGCLVVAYLLGRLHFGERHAFATAVAMAALPMSFLPHAPMTEPLFTFLLMLAIWATLTRRWALAAAAAFALALTRSTGFTVALPIAVIVWQLEGWRLTGRDVWRTYVRALPAILAGPLGWGLFLVWCKVMTGDWLAYNDTQRAGWGVVTRSPLYPITSTLADPSPKLVGLLAMVALVLAASVAAAVWLRQPGYAVLAVVLLLFPMMIGDRWQWSILRYLTPVFPVALFGVAVHRHRRVLGIGLFAVSVLLQLFLLAQWQSPGRNIII